jgi:hypothetical protein
MSRDRYDHIPKHMKYSFQPNVREPGVSQEAYRWMRARLHYEIQ